MSETTKAPLKRCFYCSNRRVVNPAPDRPIWSSAREQAVQRSASKNRASTAAVPAIAPMADIRRWRINTFPCSPGTVKHVIQSKLISKRCERPGRPAKRHSEEIKNPACLVACRGGCGEFVDGDAAFQPAEGEQSSIGSLQQQNRMRTAANS